MYIFWQLKPLINQIEQSVFWLQRNLAIFISIVYFYTSIDIFFNFHLWVQ